MILLFLILFIHFKINNLVYDFNYTSYKKYERVRTRSYNMPR